MSSNAKCYIEVANQANYAFSNVRDGDLVVTMTGNEAGLFAGYIAPTSNALLSITKEQTVFGGNNSNVSLSNNNIITPGYVSSLNTGMFKNRIVNGDMRIKGPDRFKIDGSRNIVSAMQKQVMLSANDMAVSGFANAAELNCMFGPTSNLVAYFPFDSSVIDQIRDLTPTVTGTMQYVPSLISGNALYLANEANILSASTSPANMLEYSYKHNGGDCSVSCWLYFTKIPQGAGQWNVPWSIGSESQYTFNLSVVYNTTNYGTLSLYYSGFGGTPGTPVCINTWYHVVSVFTAGSSIALYVNGGLVGTLAVSSSYFATTGNLLIGDQQNANMPFAGYIDDLRIYNRALSVSEAAALALYNPLVKTIPTTNLSSYFSFNGNLTDSQGTYTLTTTGSVSYVTGVNGQALYLANEANVVATPTKATNRLSISSFNKSSALSFTGWVNFTKLPQGASTFSSVFSVGTTTTQSFGLSCQYVSSTLAQLCVWENAQGETPRIAISTNTWHHFAAIFIPSGVNIFYLNGTYIGSGIAGGTTSGNYLLIGDNAQTSLNQPFAGYLDDFRIYSRVLNAQEIALMAGNAQVYPTAPSINLQMYFPFNGNLTDSGPSSLTMTVAAGTPQYVNGIVSNQAVYLNNEANMLAVNTKASNRLTIAYTQSTPMSVSCWFYATKAVANNLAVIWSYGTTTTDYMELWMNTSSQLALMGGNANTTGVAISTNTWYHAVGVWNPNSNHFLYLDGKLVGSGTNTQGIVAGNFQLGDFTATATNRPFAGYIDDFRVYNQALTSTQVAAIYHGSPMSTYSTIYDYHPTSAVCFQQSIDGYNIADLLFGTSVASPLALSCWIKNNTSNIQQFSIELDNNNVTSSNTPRSLMGITPVIVPGNWQKVALLIPPETTGSWMTNSNIGLNVNLVLGANQNAVSSNMLTWSSNLAYTSNNIQILNASSNDFLGLQNNKILVTGLQLEKGNMVTPMEYRPYNIEKCLAIPNIAFKVHTPANFTANYPIRFNTVEYNMGSCYNPISGIFTAPTSGFYQFDFNITNPSVSIMSAYIVKNGEFGLAYYMSTADVNVIAYGFEVDNVTSSLSGIALLNAGDYVYVSASITNASKTADRFQGFLLSLYP